MKRYALWNRTDTIYTPVGEALTPSQWVGRYGWLAHPAAIPVVAAGLINGAFVGELSRMKAMCEAQGADFSECTTNEEILAAIEAWEDAMAAQPDEPSTDERIAAALEYQVMASLPDEE